MLDKNLVLPLDVGVDDQTKFLDEHDLNEVLNRLPEEAFDIFSGMGMGMSGEGKNLDFRNHTFAQVALPLSCNFCHFCQKYSGNFIGIGVLFIL